MASTSTSISSKISSPRSSSRQSCGSESEESVCWLFRLRDRAVRLTLYSQSLSCEYTEYGISRSVPIPLPCSKSTCSRLLNSGPLFRGWSSTAAPCQHCCIQTLAMIFEITHNVLPGLGSLFHFRLVCLDDCWRKGPKQLRTTSSRPDTYEAPGFVDHGDLESAVFHKGSVP